MENDYYFKTSYSYEELKETAEYLHELAEQGNSFAQHTLALCYEKGTGVEQDYKKLFTGTLKLLNRVRYGLSVILHNGYNVQQNKEMKTLSNS